jgi:hypothetical protein
MCRQRVDNHLGQRDGPVAGLRFRWCQRGCLSLHGDELSVHRHHALKETHPVDRQPEALTLAHAGARRERDERPQLRRQRIPDGGPGSMRCVTTTRVC